MSSRMPPAESSWDSPPSRSPAQPPASPRRHEALEQNLGVLAGGREGRLELDGTRKHGETIATISFGQRGRPTRPVRPQPLSFLTIRQTFDNPGAPPFSLMRGFPMSFSITRVPAQVPRDKKPRYRTQRWRP